MHDVSQQITNLSAQQKRDLLLQLLEKKRASLPSIYPLSYGQRALWFLHQLMPESGAYNESMICRVRADLRVPALRQALQLLLERHPALRTVYGLQGDKPVQRVLEPAEAQLSVLDATAWSQEEVIEFLTRERYRPISLEQGPVFRALLLTRGPRDQILALIAHHIAIDLWSFMIVLDELCQLYTACEAGRTAPLAEPPLSYREYVRWHLDMLEGREGDALWRYWREQLSDLPAPLQLPVDHPRPAVQTFSGSAYAFTLSPQLSQQLRALARDEGVTLYTLLLAAFQVLLYRYSGQEDILVCSPTNGRTQERFARSVGYFVNPVVMRGCVKGDLPFTAFLSQMQRTVLEALERQDYPFPLLVERLEVPREGGRAPLSDVAFVMEQLNRATLSLAPEASQNAGVYNEGATGVYLRLGEFELELINPAQRKAKFDLELSVTLAGDTLSGAFYYNTDLFERATIAELADHFQTLLQSILAEPARSIDRLELLSPEWRRSLLDARHTAPARELPHVCLHELIEQQARRTPNMPAVVFEQQTLSYAELNRAANQLAHYLREAGIGPEMRVGLYMERSAAFIIGLLGILKAGGAYVPLDPALPPERVRFMIEDASIRILVVQRHLQAQSLSSDIQVIALDDDQALLLQRPGDNPAGGAAPDNLAYIIYTSGSTGKPKGVLIQHAGLVNYTLEMQRILACQPGWHFASVSTPAADLGNTSIFAALTSGGCLHLIPYQMATDGGAFAQYVARHPIDALKLTPSHLRALLAGGGRQILPCRVLILGGEALPYALVEQIREMGAECRVLNHYGPTEATIGVLVNELDHEPAPDQGYREKATASVPLGRPLGGTRVYVLDKHLQPVPVGVPGELFIGGVGLARGYCKRPELTSERFIPDPFSAQPGARLYRTGDLVRYRHAGDIEFLGRVDRQVKLRGFRVELEEIENCLAQHPAIRECAVLVSGDALDARLVAYVVAKTRPGPSTSELHRWLRERLPDYMLPSIFTYIDSMPLSANGKRDLRKLPPPDQARPVLETQYLAPRTAFERIIAQIWQDILHIEQVGLQDNFFELGGNSLLMCQIHQRVRKALQRDIPLVTLFRYPTVGSLAHYLEQGQHTSHAVQDGYDRAGSRLARRVHQRVHGRGQLRVRNEQRG